MNDTVIIFDRIREYLRMKKKFGDAKATLNLALNSTLSRTINTSLTIFLVLIAIFLFGGEVIRGFVFAMLLGIIVGTYSSIFVATAIVYDTDKTLGKISSDELEAIEKAESKKAKRLSTI
jgi:SecD/SecF fusion protein